MNMVGTDRVRVEVEEEPSNWRSVRAGFGYAQQPWRPRSVTITTYVGDLRVEVAWSLFSAAPHGSLYRCDICGRVVTGPLGVYVYNWPVFTRQEGRRVCMMHPFHLGIGGGP